MGGRALGEGFEALRGALGFLRGFQGGLGVFFQPILVRRGTALIFPQGSQWQFTAMKLFLKQLRLCTWRQDLYRPAPRSERGCQGRGGARAFG